MGRLAGVNINVANTVTNVYTPSASKTGVVTLSICNLSDSSVKFCIALQDDSNLTVPLNSWIEYNFELSPGNSYERSGLVLKNPQTISVKSSGQVAAVVWGFEE